MVPGEGRKPRPTSSALSRNSKEWPRGLGIRGEAQRFPGGDPELLLDQVDPGGFLGDGVLHLQPGVHLEERHGAVGGHQEFHGAGAGVAGLPADGLGGVVNLPRSGRR